MVQGHARTPTDLRRANGYGAIAQLGERLHGMQEVGGSIPPGSTSLRLLRKLRLGKPHASPSQRSKRRLPRRSLKGEAGFHPYCSFHALAQQSRSGESQRVRGVDFGAVRERIEPAFAKRLRRGSLRYDRVEAGLPSRSLRRLVGATGIEPVTPTMSR